MSSSTTASARWRQVVGALALTEIVSWGILYYAFGVLVSPMQAELGWSQGVLGAAFSLGLFVSALLALPVARWLEHRGPRALMTCGSCAGVVLILAWSRVHQPLAFFALFAALGFPLATVLYEPAFAAVIALLGAGRRTDLALLFLTIVAGLANTVFVPLTQWLVDEHGWRAALRILALVLGAITIPLHALVLRGVPGMDARALPRRELRARQRRARPVVPDRARQRAAGDGRGPRPLRLAPGGSRRAGGPLSRRWHQRVARGAPRPPRMTHAMSRTGTPVTTSRHDRRLPRPDSPTRVTPAKSPASKVAPLRSPSSQRAVPFPPGGP